MRSKRKNSREDKTKKNDGNASSGNIKENTVDFDSANKMNTMQEGIPSTSSANQENKQDDVDLFWENTYASKTDLLSKANTDKEKPSTTKEEEEVDLFWDNKYLDKKDTLSKTNLFTTESEDFSSATITSEERGNKHREKIVAQDIPSVSIVKPEKIKDAPAFFREKKNRNESTINVKPVIRQEDVDIFWENKYVKEGDSFSKSNLNETKEENVPSTACVNPEHKQEDTASLRKRTDIFGKSDLKEDFPPAISVEPTNEEEDSDPFWDNKYMNTADSSSKSNLNQKEHKILPSTTNLSKEEDSDLFWNNRYLDKADIFSRLNLNEEKQLPVPSSASDKPADKEEVTDIFWDNNYQDVLSTVTVKSKREENTDLIRENKKLNKTDACNKPSLNKDEHQDIPATTNVKPEKKDDTDIFWENKFASNTDLSVKPSVQVNSSVATMKSGIQQEKTDLFSENKKTSKRHFSKKSVENKTKPPSTANIKSNNEKEDSDLFSNNKTLQNVLSFKRDYLKNKDIHGVTKVDVKSELKHNKLDNTSSNSEQEDNLAPVETQSRPQITLSKLMEDAETNPEAKKLLSYFDKDDASLFKVLQTIKETEKRGKSIFDQSDSDDDLFSSNKIPKALLPVRKRKTMDFTKERNCFEPHFSNTPEVDLFTNTFATKKRADKKSETEHITGEDQKNEQENFYETINNTILECPSIEKTSQSDTSKDTAEGQGLSSSPGKLKYNLNINVAALLPGALPPRRPNLEKSISLDSSGSNQTKLSTEDISTLTKCAESKRSLEKSISFDYPAETSDILISAAKERVRIPVKRRPSTRKARQEAIRKSETDFSFDNPLTAHEAKSEAILNIANNNIMSDKLKNPLSNPLSPSTDEEDLFSVPRVQELSDNFKDNSLFGKAPIISPVGVLSSGKTEETPRTNEDNTSSRIPPLPLIKNEFKLDSDDDTDSDFDFSKNIHKRVTSNSKFIFSSTDSDDLNAPIMKAGGRKSDNNNTDLSPDGDLFKPVASTAAFLSNLSTLSNTKVHSLFDSGEGSDDEERVLITTPLSNEPRPRVNVPTRKSVKEEVTKLPVEKGDPLDALKQ